MIIAKKSTLTGAQIKSLYEAEANAFTDTKNTKLSGIDVGAEVNVGETFDAAEQTKLAGIAAGAEVNVGETFDAAEQTKLAGIAAGAEVNVGETFTSAEKSKVANILYDACEILQMQKLATAPGSPVEGDIYYDTATSTYEYYNGSAWETVKVLVEAVE